MLLRRPVVTLALLTAATFTAHASEREFSYTYDSSVLAPGQKELELWGTYGTGRDYYYRSFTERIEFEYGVAENVQTAIYLNFASITSDSEGTGIIQKDKVNGMSWEWKWKLSDASVDSIGSALYIEPEVSGQEVALELKGIIDKRIGKELFAFNFTVEPEWELEPSQPKPEIHAETNLGWSHRLNGGFSFGLELRTTSETVYSTDDEAWEIENIVVYGGPTVHFAKNGFWTTLTVMPQWFAPKNEAGNSNPNREAIGANALEVRALIGFDL